MTIQFDDFAARRSAGGWVLDRVLQRGNAHIHLLGERGDELRSFRLDASLPGFTGFAHWTTAGMLWSQHMLAYFTPGQRHLVVRSWWGARLVIDLGELRPVDPQGLADELHRFESALVLDGLRRFVAETDGGEQPEYDFASTDVTDCTVATLVHFPGLLALAEAVPLLRVLEGRLLGESGCSSSFCYYPHEYRLLVQTSLRRLGESPQGYPAMTFTDSERRTFLRTPPTGPVDGPTRHANLLRVGRDTPLSEVYRLLGPPDEIGRRSEQNFWRYDVDADLPYTTLIWLGEDDRVTRVVRYLPPFWAGPEASPSRTHSLLDADGGTHHAVLAELDTGTFAGMQVEVNLLHEIAASGGEPVAPLARAVLAGTYDAIGPLSDALEEAGDLRWAEVRSWIKA